MRPAQEWNEITNLYYIYTHIEEIIQRRKIHEKSTNKNTKEI